MKKMKKLLLIISFFLYFSPVVANTIDSSFVVSLALPILSISTIDGAMPTCEFVWPPEGEYGISTTNKTKVYGRIILSYQGNTIFDSGSYKKNEGGMSLRIRGNTSAYYSVKKPYKIKLEVKADMLGRGNADYADKEWLLIDQGNDNLNALIGLKINEMMGLGEWTPAYMYVNLIFNGEYHGIYMLIESIKRNIHCRINIDKSGYMFERDAYWWNEDIYFSTLSNKKYTFKYPEKDKITEEKIDYLKQTVNDMEKSIDEGNYQHTINVESFARWLMAHDILGSSDAAGSNIFLTKKDSTANSKVEMSVLWDFDSNFRNTDKWSNIHTNEKVFYFPQLLNSKNTLFIETYKNVWKEMSDSIFDTMVDFLKEFRTSELAYLLQKSRMYDGEKWNFPPDSVNQNIDIALQWFENRKKWLSDNINATEVPDHIINIKNTKANQFTYTLSGQRILSEKTVSGIYIRNGKKYFVR